MPGALTSGQRGEHAQGGRGNPVHSSQRVADVDGDAHDDGGDDAGLVAQGQSEDDIGSGPGAAGIGALPHRLVPGRRRSGRRSGRDEGRREELAGWIGYNCSIAIDKTMRYKMLG